MLRAIEILMLEATTAGDCIHLLKPPPAAGGRVRLRKLGSSNLNGWGRAMRSPPRGPRRDLCVVVVTTSDVSKGFATTPAATSPLQPAHHSSLHAFNAAPETASISHETDRAQCSLQYVTAVEPVCECHDDDHSASLVLSFLQSSAAARGAMSMPHLMCAMSDMR